MLCHYFMNHVVKCLANSCKSWRIMLCQGLCIMLCYAEQVVLNHDVNAMPVGVNHGEICWGSGCESRCTMLSRVCGNHGKLCCASGSESLCAMLCRECGNHGVLWWSSGWESRCECCTSGGDSWWAKKSQRMWITMCYYVPVGVNHDEVSWVSGC